MKHVIFLALFLLMLMPTFAFAQDDEDEEMGYNIWIVTEIGEDGEPVEADDADEPATEVVVVPMDDGDTLLIIWTGIDIIYTIQDDGTYSGAELYAGGGYEFTATLEIIDEDTLQGHSVVDTGNFESERTLLYERVEDSSIQLFTENERTIVEFTQFTDCLGRDGTVGTAWTRSDLLVPIAFDEAGLFWNKLQFDGGGGVFINERTQEFGSFENVITQTFTGNAEDGFDFSYEAIADGRDDCEMIYESSYTPFDGDFESIFGRAEELAEAETEE